MKTLPHNANMASLFSLPLARSTDGSIGDVVDSNGNSVLFIQGGKNVVGLSNSEKIEHKNLRAEAAAIAVNSYDDMASQIEQLKAENAVLKAKLAEKK